MKLLNTPPIKLTAAIAMATMLVSCAVNTVSFAKTLATLDQPITVELKSNLDSKTTPKGTPFEAVSTEEYKYLGGVIPAGTRFKGQVQESKASRSFARAGYVVLKVEEALYPTGEVYQISDKAQAATPSQKIINPKANTFKRNVQRNAPITTASLATSMPLQFATGLNSAIIFPIALGARMITGATSEVISKNDEGRNLPAQIGYGVWRGTGIPGALSFVKKPKELQLKPGDTVNLQLDPSTLKSLFLVKNQETTPAADASTPNTTPTTGLTPEVQQPESAQNETPAP